MNERADELIPAGEKLPVQTPSNRYLASEIMQRRGFNPIEKMVDLAEELEEKDAEAKTGVYAEKRLKIYTTLAKYYAPMPKSIDINVQADHSYKIEAVNFEDLYNRRKHMIAAAKEPELQMIDVTESTEVHETESTS